MATKRITELEEKGRIDSTDYLVVDGANGSKRIKAELIRDGEINLLDPTLQTSTLNGVTCTDNGDGTYTLNGTATNNTYFNFTPSNTPASSNWNKINKGTYRFVGHKPNTTSKLSLQITDTTGTVYHSDETFEIANDNTPYKVYLYIENGKSFDNLTFKPMLTPNLSATYEDFVPYTLSNRDLTKLVAQLLNQ